MKSVEEFTEKFVDISFIENSECYGHYPFQLFSTDKFGKSSMNALALGGDVKSCYDKTKELLLNGSTTYLSLDFPAIFDAKHDFVAVHEVKNNKLSVFAIPYDPNTGEVFEKEFEGKYIDEIKKQFNANVFD